MLRNGVALDASMQNPVNVADVKIFQRNSRFQKKAKRKIYGECTATSDIFPLSRKYPHSWGVLMDKAYQV